jgi:histidinol dehydrogenase
MAEPVLAPEVKAAFDTAFSNISAFHAAQRREPLEVETMPGVRCRRVTRPIGALAPRW